MTEEEAAWVRAHVWTQAMRKTFAEVPGFYLACACQHGLTSWCQQGRHGRCHRAEPLSSSVTTILKRGGIYPALLSEPYEHKAASATGPHETREAQVWLADRVCAWRCPCECHSAAAEVEQAGPGPTPSEADPHEVLAYVKQRGLVDADCTIEQLPPPAYRAYAEWRRVRTVIEQQDARRDAETRQWWAEAKASADAKQQARDRRDRIRAWGRARGWKVEAGPLPRRLVEAYAVAEEGAGGQPTLF